MDYKEKYEELVEAARAVVEGNPGLCNMNKRLGRVRDLLPEKESEDERIRKSLVDYFRKFKPQDMWDDMFSIGDVISYLEKQREKVVEFDNDREQQPVDYTEELEKCKENPLYFFDKYVKIKMKHAERHLGMKDQWCCNAAWAAVRDSDAYNGEEKQSILDFLQRYELQPHWKPSEEQIQALTVAIDEAARCEEPYWRDSLHDVLLSLHTDLKKQM